MDTKVTLTLYRLGVSIGDERRSGKEVGKC